MTIQVGLIGYGLAGSVFHAPLIQYLPELALKIIVSSDPTKVHRSYPNVLVVPTLDVLLTDEDIALVVIATPNETHYTLAKQAIEAGKHVVVDKPFVISSAQADELILLAHTHNVLLSIYQNRRWDNDFLTIRHLIETGILGDVATYEAHYDRFRPVVRDRWREQAVPGSGTLYDLGSHLIDQALVLFGVPETVWADIRTQRTGAKTDDYFHIVLGYPERVAILHSGCLVRESGPHFQVHGSKGSFLKYGLDPQEDALKTGKLPDDSTWGQDEKAMYGELTTDVGDLPVKGKVQTLPGHYDAFYQGMVEAIIGGKPVPVLAEEARNTIRVIEAAQRSYREQRTIIV
jgi:scyllo-inositol 2-dehydrogenase (NADP+)